MKFLLFLYCSGFRAQSSQVHVLWEDHRNDIFINGFGTYSGLWSYSIPYRGHPGLLMSAGGSKLRWCKYLGFSTDPSD